MVDEGVITLRTSFDAVAREVTAEVVDRGMGIRTADRTKIFETNAFKVFPRLKAALARR